MGFIYASVVIFLRIVVRVFFRKIVVLGKDKVPKEEGIILAGNHPNALMDPIVVVATSPRRPGFLAKSGLFRLPLLGSLLRATGTLPVYRKQDSAPQLEEKETAAHSNESMFKSCHEQLANRGAIALFPEGISEDDPFLHHLKTGAARILLGAADLSDGATPLSIVPVGLHYTHPDKFRSRLFVEYGDPIRLTPKMLEDWRDPAIGFEMAKKLTALLEESLLSVTVVADEWETLELAHAGRKLYQPPQGTEYSPHLYTEWTRRFIKGYERAMEAGDEDMAVLVRRLKNYQLGLNMLGLEPSDVQQELTVWRFLVLFFFRLVFVFLGLPIALVALLLHWPIVLWCHLEGNKWRSRDKRELVATWKIIIATFGLPVLYIVESVLFGVFVTKIWWIVLLFVVFLPFSLYVFMLVAELEISVVQSFIGLWRMVLFPKHVQQLRVEGEELTGLISVLVERWREGGEVDQAKDVVIDVE